MTLILTSIFLVKAGLSGKSGMLAALLIGGVVCTALSMAGGLITDLKVGYWIGATPAVQERSKLLGTLVAALTVGSVILLLNKAYGFVAGADALRGGGPRRAAGERDGGRHQDAHVERAGSLAPLRRRGAHRDDDADDRRSRARLRPRDVHPAGAEHAARRRRPRGALRREVGEGKTRSSTPRATRAGCSSPPGSSRAAPSWASSRRSSSSSRERQYRRLLPRAGTSGTRSGTSGELLALGAYILLAAYMYWDSRRTDGEA